MNLLKINEILTKAMIGTFVSIVAFTFISMVITPFAYLVAILLLLLMAMTAINFVLSGFLILRDINKMIEKLFIAFHEQQSVN